MINRSTHIGLIEETGVKESIIIIQLSEEVIDIIIISLILSIPCVRSVGSQLCRMLGLLVGLNTAIRAVVVGYNAVEVGSEITTATVFVAAEVRAWIVVTRSDDPDAADAHTNSRSLSRRRRLHTYEDAVIEELILEQLMLYLMRLEVILQLAHVWWNHHYYRVLLLDCLKKCLRTLAVVTTFECSLLMKGGL